MPDPAIYLTGLFGLTGVNAVVTGAGSGIGQGIATALARAGADVVIGDVDMAAAAAVAEELVAAGLSAHAVQVDVADRASVEGLFTRAERLTGPVGAVFANAGISGGLGHELGGRIEDLDRDLWQRVLAVNLDGALNTVQAAAGRMRGSGGRIAVTASIAGTRGDGMVGYPYVTSKAAVINLVRQAALDLAGDDILVNAILPGPFRTSIGAPVGSPRRLEMDARFARTIPLKRLADIDEIAGLAVFLASPASSFVTGAAIAIDGGSIAGRFDES
jgi:NAD(P)-dependent dehydrogenase (short-subunit alcohol dehydrogenase family)